MLSVHIIFGVLSFSICLVSALDLTTLQDITARIKSLINNDANRNPTIGVDPRLVGGLVRLAFHDCVGTKCDGCINLSQADNAGLDVYISLIEPLYQQLLSEGVVLSRADYWAIAATTAVYYAADLAPGCRTCAKPVPAISYQTGREDCSTSPSTTDIFTFPSAFFNTSEVLNFFNSEFGFNAQESTVILGAHTLGRAHRNASGFIHPWDAKPAILDNEFYIHLMDPATGWVQTNVGNSRNPLWQWTSTTTPTTLMLDSDVSLIKDLGVVSSSGQASCTFSACPATTSSTLTWATAYKNNNTLFISDFSSAFQKMISKGYTSLSTVV